MLKFFITGVYATTEDGMRGSKTRTKKSGSPSTISAMTQSSDDSAYGSQSAFLSESHFHYLIEPEVSSLVLFSSNQVVYELHYVMLCRCNLICGKCR